MEGETYWFDLSSMGIPGTQNTSLPGTALTWVPFTYVGEVMAYSRTWSGISQDSDVSPYAHRLFIAEYNITQSVSWKSLDDNQLIFGKTYTSGGVNYTLRTPSVGSNGNWNDENPVNPATPASNEWDTILGKDASYIKNWSGITSHGQDTSWNAGNTSLRGNHSARFWSNVSSQDNHSSFGFRPVLEIPSTLSSNDLKIVTVDLNGGTVGTIAAGSVNLVVNSTGNFTAPSSDGLTPPEGTEFSVWADNNGTYSAGSQIVSASLNQLKAQWKQVEPADNEGYTIDYLDESIPAQNGYELAATATATTGSDRLELTPGVAVYVRKTEANGYLPSDWHENSISDRPVAPEVQAHDETVRGRNNGKITVPDSAEKYQYSPDNGTTWMDATLTNNEIANLAPGNYKVRLAAIADVRFHGEETNTVTIGVGAEPTYTLNVTAPSFDAVYFGYTRPAAKAITITSTGNSDTEITSVKLSDDVKTAFTLNKEDGCTITAGATDNATYTIQPAEKLGIGTYTATITVTNAQNETAETVVSFTVMGPPCTLTFETNGGSQVAPLTKPYGEKVGLTGYLPAREGYVFDGWFADKALTKRITEITLDGGKTVYAGWTATAPAEQPAQSSPDAVKIPQTGDGFDLAGVIGLMLLSAAAMAAAALLRRKNRL